MRERPAIRFLPNDHRLHLNDGPIDLIISADGAPENVDRAYQAATRRFATILDELCAELPLLRARVTEDSPGPAGPIARCMFESASVYQGRSFITPMAAVAGAVAEDVIAAMTGAASLSRAYVNNGGDIALYLASGQNYRIGMVERPDYPSLFGTLEISAGSAVRGIATSGWRGRSFSLGIADAVTVLARSAAQADAATTIIANAVDLPGHPGITRVPARDIAPDSDLLDLPVTRDVPSLSKEEILTALSSGECVAADLRAQGLIEAAALCLQGHVRISADDLYRLSLREDRTQTESCSRSLQNA
jgi:hypothetical protein